MAKILISAGEASGDIHAAAVTAAIKKLDSKAEVFGMGGDALRQAGGALWCSAEVTALARARSQHDDKNSGDK